MSDTPPEEWLNVAIGTDRGKPNSTATTLEAVAKALRNAPEEYRYDISLEVVEQYPDEDTDRGESQ